MIGLFEPPSSADPQKEDLAPGAFLLRGFALPDETAHLDGLREVTAKAPFRHMVTPGGFRMSVAMTNCGAFGWITDEKGYRYDRVDPETNNTWPGMSDCFLRIASSAAAE